MAERLEALRQLVYENPGLVERDHGRAERHRQRVREASVERRKALKRGDQHTGLSGEESAERRDKVLEQLREWGYIR